MTMPFGTPRRRWRTLGAGIVLLLMASHLVLGIITDRRLRKTVARLEQKYGSLDPATMAPPAVPDIENRVRLIRAAQQAIALTREDMQRIAAVQSTDDPTLLQQNAPALQKTIDSNRVVFDLLVEASKLGRSDWKIDYGKGVNATFPRMLGNNGVRSLTDIVAVRARLQILAGNLEDAAGTMKLGFAIGESFAGEKMFWLGVWQDVIISSMIRPLREVVSANDPPADQLLSLQQLVVASFGGGTTRHELECEMKSIHSLFEELEAGEWAKEPFKIDEWYLQNPPVLWLCLPALRDDHAYALDLWDRIIDASKASERIPWGQPLQLDLPHPPRWYQIVSKAEVAWELSDFERYRRRGTTRASLAVTALALRRYRLDTGSYPNDLGAIVPAYLPTLPMDAFTVNPPHYRKQGGGFQLWSEAEKTAYKNNRMDPILRWEVPR